QEVILVCAVFSDKTHKTGLIIQFQIQPVQTQTGNTKDKIQFRLNAQLPIDNALRLYQPVGS
ncbi:MAG TPA: hypothetical protein PKZ32_02445, partial [Candidatus Melainabacteria bacterium]|nr:hypothetical protein [Candidatus Melainabacteria bacterium]